MHEGERTISQFMWGYQPHFRMSVRTGIEMAFEAIGFPGEPEVTLVGFKVAGNHAFDVCVEPEAGPYGPADFAGIAARAEELYKQNPESDVRYSHRPSHEARHRALRDEMRAEAVAVVFQKHSAGHGQTFFASRSTRVGDYEVHVVLGVATDALEAVPQLRTTSRDRFPITPSLVHALIDEVFRRANVTLYLPDPGAGPMPLGASTPEIVRGATERLVRSIFMCAGYWFSENTDLLLSSISALPYEGRAGRGGLVLAKQRDPAIEVMLKIREPVDIRKTRAVRKLMEASGAEADLLVAEGKVYGLGQVTTSYNETSETVFRVSVLGRGAWDLSHGAKALLSVRDGVAHLPVHVLDEPLLGDLVERLLPSADLEVLVDLARAAGDNEHGAMLVISGDAGSEAERLSPQAWAVDPSPLSTSMMRQLTGMDGAVLVDPQGRCHAIGVILDGHAAGQGDPARGSRFNNAVRYIDTDPPPAVIVVYSADGTIDILPPLHPRVARERVTSAVQRYLSLAAARPPRYEHVYAAWEAVKALRFYLSEEQCRDLNEARVTFNEWRKDQGDGISIIESDLDPDPRMNDSYWLG